MWKKILIVIFLFYFFALLQKSFFTHFSLFGFVPNLVFILFFLLVFFEGKFLPALSGKNYQIIFLAATAGFFLDIFSSPYLGPFIVLLAIIGISLKKAQALLKNRSDNYPFIYFLPLFVFFLLIYDILSDLYLNFLVANKIVIIFDARIIFFLICNAIIASIFFYVYKKFFEAIFDERQLRLFK